MASPTAEPMQNGISTPPATTTAPQPSPPSQSTQQPTTQPPASQLTNGTSTATATTTAAAAAAAASTKTPTTTNMNPPFPSTSLLDPGTSKRPRDARLIHLILANMGVTAYTERVPLQLLDFAYRYTSSILTDAISYEPPTALAQRR
ncbi:hypothetical protein LEMA_P092220.1 [Plenodomus lingam JN3]|uniref:TFIID-31kDa-domain-containing protein n=1 Tax=Leptosphaeria maculans (strain JN3 / isolate v23.1.3 / race Av1-4-5-6-7-8) TaxID=985895 RepID=E5A2L7_LEPMJ|nr:hypothetical protein LEMA_P092220.1 [Plenodomus lingam JN3]CBX97813.1 hypothetical protein LEMA_P092220.1 [Plenodomus lingam JN3]